MAASSVWKGTLSFGLVSVPVRLVNAHQRHGPQFHQFVRDTNARVRYRKVNEETGEEVQTADIVKGAPVDDEDEYVVLEAEELAEIAPGRSKTMEVERFVPAGSVQTRYFDAAYYLAPDTKAAAKPYTLLCAILERQERLALSTLVLRDRQHLVLIGPQSGVLTLSTLWWPDEIRDPDEVLPSFPDVSVAERDLDLAAQLVDAMAAPWRPEDYTDSYQQRLEELIDAKATGRRMRHPSQEAPRDTKVVELTDALRASLKSGRSSGDAKPATQQKARTSKPGRGRESGNAKLESMTKRELLREAAKAEVAGRSTMTRDQLQDALAKSRRFAGAS